MKVPRPYLYALASAGLGLASLGCWYAGGALVIEALTLQVEQETAEHEKRVNAELARSLAEVAELAGDGEDRRPVRVVAVDPPFATVENARGDRLTVRIPEGASPKVGELWPVTGSHYGPTLGEEAAER